MAEPDLPVFPRIALAISGAGCIAKHSPLRPKRVSCGIVQIGGQIPPLDTIIGVSRVILWKRDRSVRIDHRISFGAEAKPRETLSMGDRGNPYKNQCK